MALGNKELAVVLKLVSDQFQRELKKTGSGVDGLLSKFNSWKVGIAAAGGALFAIAKTTANYGDALAKNAQSLGINVEALAGLQHAANIAGADIAKLRQGLGLLSKNAADAASGTGEAKIAFEAMGFSVKDAEGKLKATDDLILDLADRFSRMEDSAGKTALAMRIFGESGKDLIPFLNEGRAGIQGLMEEAERLGLVMSAEDAAAAEEFNDALTRLGAAATGLRNQIGTGLIPVLTGLINVITELASGTTGQALSRWFKGVAGSFALLVSAAKRVGIAVGGMGAVVARVLEGNFATLLQDVAVIKDQVIRDLDELDTETETRLRNIFEGTKKAGPSDGPGLEAAPSLPDKAKKGKAKDPGKEQEQLGKDLVDLWTGHFATIERLRQKDFEDQVVKAELALQLARNSKASKDELAKAEVAVIAAQRERDLQNLELTENQKALIIAQAQGKVQEKLGEFGINGEEITKKIAQGMQGNFEQFFFSAFQGRVESLEDVLGNFANLANQIASQVLSKFATEAIFGGLSGGGGGAGGLFSTLFAAQGGVFPKRMAGGGVLTGQRPEAVIAGEAGKPEAFVPLPDGRSIPVAIQGGVAQGAVIELTILNEVRPPTGGGGGQSLTRADVVNIIDANMRDGGTIRRTIRKGR